MDRSHSYESSDPKRYEQALGRVEEFEALPDSEHEAVFKRVVSLRYGTLPDGSDGMGAVEAIAQAMDERDALLNPTDTVPHSTMETTTTPITKPGDPGQPGA